ncbi:glycerate kinase [Paludibacterium paludis]|uniref:Kinase n=1 Tax=Paludibacterium paludis TaxID=1225769 RepID=A0A918NYV6_9NEIS|nr:glycerate kinase [Paludibacterium paludis]GGY05157.1 kinase [Paludibacterium paludis]
MKWVLAPDSFKGSLPAALVANAMAEGIARADEGAEFRFLPMADGGEGTLDAIHAAIGGTWRQARVSDAAGQPCEAACLLAGSGHAVIEVARVVGLAATDGTDVMRRSSRGVGELILRCLDEGATRVSVALGGSGTNDGGAGCLVGLGARLLGKDGDILDGSPASLAVLDHVDLSGVDPRLARVRLEIWSDVDNPLTGEAGATAVFGPQKGVAPEALGPLDGVIRRFADELDRQWGRAVSGLPGAGAAGGLGYVLQGLGAARRAGAEEVARLAGLGAALTWADRVLTGEGRSDAQTLRGKVPGYVAAQAAAAGVPVTLLSGSLDSAALASLSPRFQGCFSLCVRPMSLAEAMRDAPALLADSAEQIARLALPAQAGS